MPAKNHPGVYIPPPVIYAGFFFLSLALERAWPVGGRWFHAGTARTAGWILVLSALLFLFPALWRFIASKNTVVTIRPANSLQTKGVYAVTRNPMYLGLLLLYFGLAFLLGNTWTLILAFPLVIVVQEYIIRKEETYLREAFRDEYRAYKRRVRRWL